MNRATAGHALNQNLINHVVFVLDASSSMSYYGHDKKIIDVVESQVKYLARRARELQQQTRVSVYTFDDTARCVLWDLDVHSEIEWTKQLRSLYKPRGNTAMVSATLLALRDLAEIMTKYGDHGFLVYVLTDGEENRSSSSDRSEMPRKLKSLPDNWTVACLVPDPDRALPEAKQWGFPADNISVWNATRADGVEEAGLSLQRATDTYMVGRSQGVQGSRNLFSTGADAVNKATVSALMPLHPDLFTLSHVTDDTRIDDWIRTSCGLPFRIGIGHYQLTKREKIQAGKKIGILEDSTGRVFYGPEARQLIGLPNDIDVSVKPDHNKDYTIFVQSKAPNRKLLAHTRLLIIPTAR